MKYDWEWDYISDDTTPAQFKVTFSAVGKALKAAGLLLTFSPATDNNMDAETVSNHFDIISFQLYSNTKWPAEFIKDGVKPDNFAYGAMFEVNQGTTTPFQDADNAYSEMQKFGFKAEKFLPVFSVVSAPLRQPDQRSSSSLRCWGTS